MTSSIGFNGAVQFSFMIAAVIFAVFFAQRLLVRPKEPGVGVAPRLEEAVWFGFAFAMSLGLALIDPTGAELAGDPSVLLTVGAGVGLFGALVQWVVPTSVPEPYAHRPSEGALLMAVALVLRLASTLQYQGYLPTDATGDGCYQMLEALTLLCFLSGVKGLSAREAVRVALMLAISVACAVQCYGDLDGKPFYDRVYATSVYAETFYVFLLVAVLTSAEAHGHFNPRFLALAAAQAVLRTTFWVLARPEVKPLKPAPGRLVEYFPDVIVAVSAVQALLPGVALLHAWSSRRSCAPASLPPLVTPKGESFAATQAAFEGGILAVEYTPI